MKLLYLTLLFSLSLFVSAQKPSLASLKEKMQARLKTVEGEFGVAFKDLQTQETLFINEHENFHAASTMKTPVMIEIFKQAKAKKFKLTDSILVKNEFKSIVDGSPFKLDISDDSADDMYRQIGKKMTIYDLTYQMIIVSSNLATNVLIELVDAKNVNATMRQLDAQDMQVLRGVEDTKAFQKGLNNSVTAFDLLLIFEKIAQKKVVNPKACDAMIRILFDQKFNEIIPAQLPTEVKVAHKTGSITGVQHDSGIVFLPDGRKYVLVLLSKKLTNPKEGVKALADISRLIYEAIK